MYLNILEDDFLHIQRLDDIRQIYDALTDGEIVEDDSPDGVLFRNEAVFIKNDQSGKMVHIPPRSEESISNILNDWISFINIKKFHF